MTQIFVTPARLQEHLDDPNVVIVDGSWYLPTQNRDPEAEYLAEHIPGAVRFDIDSVRDTSSSLPHMLPSPDEFARRIGAMGIGDDTIVIVYDGAGLFSAPRVRWTFRAFGAKDVRILEGGFPAWKAEGRPVESGPGRKLPPKVFTPTFDPASVADAPKVREALATASAQVVDARPAERFRGEAPEPRPGVRAGHMPGSINLPFPTIIDNGKLKDKAGIEKALTEAGIDVERPVITSCGSGVSAAILSLALETAGHPAKALYDGSWADWGSREDLPIATGDSRAR
jgi:thiosulfate/3-mercaptopyruvate sulfurtransferase